jgi:hypothetical protein
MDWYFDNIGILFLIGVFVIIFIGIIGNGNKKKNVNKNMFDKVQKQKTIDERVRQPLNIEESKKQLEEIKKKVENVRKNTEKIALQVKIQNAAKQTIPMAKFRLEELRRHNNNLEKGQTPEILENSVMNIISNLEWFVEQEKEYPGAPWLITNNPSKLIEDAKNRYNQMLLRLASSSFHRYEIVMVELVTEVKKTEHTQIIFETIDELRGFADTNAQNYKQLFKELDDLHFQVEEIYSNTIIDGKN